MTMEDVICDLEEAISYLKTTAFLISEESGEHRKILKFINKVEHTLEEYEEDDEDEDDEDDCEEEETKPVIQIATSNPYVENALSVLEGFLGRMGDSSNSWPTEVRLRAAELILNYHKE